MPIEVIRRTTTQVAELEDNIKKITRRMAGMKLELTHYKAKTDHAMELVRINNDIIREITRRYEDIQKWVDEYAIKEEPIKKANPILYDPSSLKELLMSAKDLQQEDTHGSRRVNSTEGHVHHAGIPEDQTLP